MSFENFCGQGIEVVSMNKKLRKAVAIISLVFMGLFVVSLVLCLIDIGMLNGSIGFVALLTGFIGISLFFVLHFNDRAEKRNEEARKRHDLTDADKPESVEDGGKTDTAAECETGGEAPTDTGEDVKQDQP